VTQLAGYGKTRRREIHFPLLASEFGFHAPAHRDSLQSLEAVDVEIGAPKLAIRDASQAEGFLFPSHSPDVTVL
jgi:hypothetical protein